MTRLDFRPTATISSPSRAAFATSSPTAIPRRHVPGCPDWTPPTCCGTSPASSISGARSSRPAAGPDGSTRPPRPDGYDAMLAAFDAESARPRRRAGRGRPDRAGLDLVAASRRSGSAYRRQAHEALIHRLDAEQTARRASHRSTRSSPPTASTRRSSVMFGGPPSWGTFTAPRRTMSGSTSPTPVTRSGSSSVQFTGTDPDDDVTYDVGDIIVVDDPGPEPRRRSSAGRPGPSTSGCGAAATTRRSTSPVTAASMTASGSAVNHPSTDRDRSGGPAPRRSRAGRSPPARRAAGSRRSNSAVDQDEACCRHRSDCRRHPEQADMITSTDPVLSSGPSDSRTRAAELAKFLQPPCVRPSSCQAVERAATSARAGQGDLLC